MNIITITARSIAHVLVSAVVFRSGSPLSVHGAGQVCRLGSEKSTTIGQEAHGAHGNTNNAMGGGHTEKNGDTVQTDNAVNKNLVVTDSNADVNLCPFARNLNLQERLALYHISCDVLEHRMDSTTLSNVAHYYCENGRPSNIRRLI